MERKKGEGDEAFNGIVAEMKTIKLEARGVDRSDGRKGRTKVE